MYLSLFSDGGNSPTKAHPNRLDYLTAGQAFDHLALNRIYEAFEAKLALALGKKSPFVIFPAATDGQAPFGRLVAYISEGSPSTRSFTLGLSAHNEATYTAVAAAATVVAWDDTRHIAWADYDDATADGSLRCLTRTHSGLPYYLGPGFIDSGSVLHTQRPERRHPFAVVDVLCEGVTTLTIPADHNKYGCWRLHNLNLTSLTVTYTGGPTLTIPPLECRTVRVDHDATGIPIAWEQSGRYFWKARATDPFPMAAQGPLTGYHPQAPENYYRASNILNWRVALEWIALLNPTYWDFDPTVLYDLGATYRALFGDPEDSATKIGDLYHHKGNLRVTRHAAGGDVVTTSTFAGYSHLGDTTGDIQLSAQLDGSIKILRAGSDSLTVEAVSSNLTADSSGTCAPATFGAGGFTQNHGLDWHLQAVDDWATDTQATTSQWRDGAGDLITENASYTRALTRPAEFSTTATWAPQHPPCDTIADLLQAASNAGYSITGRALSPAGFALTWSKAHPYSVVEWWPSRDEVGGMGAASALSNPGWTNYGWTPAGGSIPHWPRIARHTAALGGDSIGGWTHPDARDLDGGVDGAPSGWPGFDDTLELTALDETYQGPCPAASAVHPWQWWATYLREAGTFYRIPRTFECHNLLAWRINQLTHARPLTIWDIEWHYGSSALRLEPNARGLALRSGGADSGIRPVNCYSAWGADTISSDHQAILTRLSLPVSTSSDLPTTWQDVVDATAPGLPITYLAVKETLTCTANSRTYRAADGMWRAQASYTYAAGKTVTDSGATLDPAGYDCSPDVFGSQTFQWLQAEDVADLCTRLGLEFPWSQHGRALEILSLDVGTVDWTSWSNASGSFTYYSRWTDHPNSSNDQTALAAEGVIQNAWGYDWAVPSLWVRFVGTWGTGATVGATPEWVGPDGVAAESGGWHRSEIAARDTACQPVRGTQAYKTFYYATDGYEDPIPSAPPLGSGQWLVIYGDQPRAIAAADAMDNLNSGHWSFASAGCVDESVIYITPTPAWQRAPDYPLGSLADWQRWVYWGADLSRQPVWDTADASQATRSSNLPSRTIWGPPAGELQAHFTLHTRILVDLDPYTVRNLLVGDLDAATQYEADFAEGDLDAVTEYEAEFVTGSI
jgi:hypothetical protein